jgi:predicted DNA binding CopG/RHH family protein
MKLDKEERDLVRSIERGEWRSVKNLPKQIKRHTEYAKATFRKDKRVNIRISEKDLNAIQSRALEEGIPYQTLMSSILHKFVNGALKAA